MAKKKSKTWLDLYIVHLMNLYYLVELDNNLSSLDRDKLKDNINSMKLILNKYAQN